MKIVKRTKALSITVRYIVMTSNGNAYLLDSSIKNLPPPIVSYNRSWSQGELYATGKWIDCPKLNNYCPKEKWKESLIKIED